MLTFWMFFIYLVDNVPEILLLVDTFLLDNDSIGIKGKYKAEL